MFVTWAPESLLQSKLATFQIARMRDTILSQLSSTHHIETFFCQSLVELKRSVLTQHTSASLTNPMIVSRTAESFSKGVSELGILATPLERLAMVNVWISVEVSPSNIFLRLSNLLTITRVNNVSSLSFRCLIHLF